MAATLAELLAGKDMEGWEAFCDEVYNNIKNHWRQSDPKTALTSVVPGMIASDEDDEKLWHRLAASWSEILQGAVNSNIIDDIQLAGGTDLDTILIPYEETTNDAIIWGLPLDPKRGLIFGDVADIAGDFTGLVTASAYPQISLVDLDIDSMIQLGFTADDKPTITLRSGAYYALIQESQAEGLAGADMRIGLDESLRMLMLTDRGDINNDFGLVAANHPSLYIWNAAGSQYLYMSYNRIYTSDHDLEIYSKQTATFFITTDNPDDSGIYRFASNANIEVTGNNLAQAWVQILAKVNQTGTAAFDGLYVNATLTSQGDGSTGDGNNLFRLAVAGTTRAKIDTVGAFWDILGEDADFDDGDVITTGFAGGGGLVIAYESTGPSYSLLALAGTSLTGFQDSGDFSTTKDNAGTYNVYFDAGVLCFQNKVGDDKSASIAFYGTPG